MLSPSVVWCVLSPGVVWCVVSPGVVWWVLSPGVQLCGRCCNLVLCGGRCHLMLCGGWCNRVLCGGCMLSPVVVILSPCVVHKGNINFKQACFLGISLPKANLEGVAMEPLCFSCTCFVVSSEV